MSRGITPRFTTWCPEPTTPLGRDNPDGAPLEYHVRLLEAYRDALDAPRPASRRPATASRAPATPSSPSARSWTRSTRTRSRRGGGAGVTGSRSTRRRGSGTRRPTRSCSELAQAVRARWHEPDHATYMVMRIINYTNVCVAQCDYCAFYVLPNQEGGYVLARERGVREDRRAARRRRRPGRVQRRLQPEAAARLLLRPLRRGARALRRPGRVLRADGRRVRLPRRPRRALARRGGRAAARRRRALGDGRRQRDPHRGLPQAARQVQVHGRRVLRGAARDRRERACARPRRW